MAALAKHGRRQRSDGYYHAQITYWLMPIAFLIGMWISDQPEQAGHCALLSAFGCWLGIFLSPDLDQPSLTTSEWRVLHIPIVGRWLLGPLFIAFWMPYAMFFKHRSFWTHAPIVSTIGRLLYCGAGYILVQSIAITLHLPPISSFIPRGDEVHLWLAAIVGLMLSDFGHWLRDYGYL